MFLKVSKSRGHRYLRVAASYRDPETGKPKQRYLFQLGRADQLQAANVDNLINGLLRETGRPSIDEISRGMKSDNTTFLPARQLGDVPTAGRISTAPPALGLLASSYEGNPGQN